MLEEFCCVHSNVEEWRGVKTGGGEEGGKEDTKIESGGRDNGADGVSGGIIIPFALSYARIYPELSYVRVCLSEFYN
jgi:hypothetical protein